MNCRRTLSTLGDERVLRFKCDGCKQGASIEHSEVCMREVVRALVKYSAVDEVVLADAYSREYSGFSLDALKEIAQVLENYQYWGPRHLTIENCERCRQERKKQVGQVLEKLAGDPLRAFADLREMKTKIETRTKRGAEQCKRCRKNFLGRVINPLISTLEQVRLVNAKPGRGRKGYASVLIPSISPCFIKSKIKLKNPESAELVDAYELDDSEVRIYHLPHQLQHLYFLIPPEYHLPPEQVLLLQKARQTLLEQEPEDLELGQSQTYENVKHLSQKLLANLAVDERLDVEQDKIKKLANYLTKYTLGLGVLETLLTDEKVQDIYVDAPIGKTPLHIYHQDFEECLTNIFLTPEDTDSLVSRFRAISGRPFSEADPVLDLNLGGIRVAAIQKPLSPEGVALALRRHKPTPWTLPQFIQRQFLTPHAAGLLSLLVDSQMSILVTGSRGSGKTSLLGALMLELPLKFRIISVEDTLELPNEHLRALGFKIQSLRTQSAISGSDVELRAEDALKAALRLGESVLVVGEVRSSIRGSEEVVIVENGWMKRVPIASLENKPVDEILVPTLGGDYKIRLTKLFGFVKHPPRKKLLRVTTKTGRTVTVTHDHSLFTTDGFRITPVETSKMRPGDRIVLPTSLPSGYNDLEYLDVTEIVPESRLAGVGDLVRKAISVLGWRKATEICEIRCGDIYNYFRTHQKTRIPIKAFKALMNEAGIQYSLDNIKVKHGNCTPIPARIPVNEKFCKFLGYYVSEGFFANGGVTITNSNKKILKDVVYISRDLFGINPTIREVCGAGKSKQVLIQSSPLARLISRLGCGRTCTEKRVPLLIFGLPKQKIGAFLKALYSGDGSFYASKKAGNEVRYSTTSKKLAEDVAYLLLTHGIVARIRKRKRDKRRNDIWQVEFKQRDAVRTFLNEIGFVQKRPRIISRAWSHSTANAVAFGKGELRKHSRLRRKYRHLARFCRCSKHYLRKVVADKGNEVSKQLHKFAVGDFYLDEIKRIEEVELKEPEPVYDLSVNPSQNFVGGFGGILLHNTEAKSLYEAMRVGAAGNSVMGTIHGSTAKDVFERVVYDLEIPPSSFKATDAIIVAAPIRLGGSVSRVRRLTQITEVRKEWRSDPISENGFVDLMTYDPSRDKLAPTPVLLQGRSHLINTIAQKWSVKPAEVLRNLQLRAKIQENLIKAASKLGKPELLEAEFVVQSNLTFHRLLEEELKNKKVRYDTTFKAWRKWLEEVA